MATLHVRNVPEKLYKRIQQMADQKRRSLSAQVINILEGGVERQAAAERNLAVLDEMRRHRQASPRMTTDSVELLREDRER